MKRKTQKTVLVICLAIVMMLMLGSCGARAILGGLSDLADGASDSGSSTRSAPSSAADSSEDNLAGSLADTKDLSNQLVGHWSEIDIDNTYTFNADGTGVEVYEDDAWTMTWTLNGNVLTMDFPATGVEEYEITIKGDTLIVHNPIIEYEYKRQ